MLTQNEFNRIMIFFEEQFAGYPYEFLNLKDICKKYKKEHGSSKKLAEITEELEKIFIKELRHVQIDTLRRLNAIYRFRIFFPKSCHEEFMEKGIHVDENGCLQELDWTDTQYFGEPKSDNVIGYLKDLGSTSLRVRSIEELARGYKEWREANLNLKTPIEVEPYLIWRIPEILKDVIETPNLTDVAKVTIMMLTGTRVPKQFRNRLNKIGKVITDEEGRIVYFKEKDVELQQNYAQLGLDIQRLPNAPAKDVSQPLENISARQILHYLKVLEKLSENETVPLSDKEIEVAYNESIKEPSSGIQNLSRKIPSLNEEIVSYEQIPVSSRIKMLFATQTSINADFLTRMTALKTPTGLNLDEYGRIIKFHSDKPNCEMKLERELLWDRFHRIITGNMDNIQRFDCMTKAGVLFACGIPPHPELLRKFYKKITFQLDSDQKIIYAECGSLRDKHAFGANTDTRPLSRPGQQENYKSFLRKIAQRNNPMSKNELVDEFLSDYPHFDTRGNVENFFENLDDKFLKATIKNYDGSAPIITQTKEPRKTKKKTVETPSTSASETKIGKPRPQKRQRSLTPPDQLKRKNYRSRPRGEPRVELVEEKPPTLIEPEEVPGNEDVHHEDPQQLHQNYDDYEYFDRGNDEEEQMEVGNPIQEDRESTEGNGSMVDHIQADDESKMEHISGDNGNQEPMGNMERKVECHQENVEKKLIPAVGIPIYDYTGRVNCQYVENDSRNKEIESQSEFVQHNFESLKSDTGSNEPDVSETKKELIESQGKTIGTSDGNGDPTVREKIPTTETNCPVNNEMDDGEVDVTMEDTPLNTDNEASVYQKATSLNPAVPASSEALMSTNDKDFSSPSTSGIPPYRFPTSSRMTSITSSRDDEKVLKATQIQTTKPSLPVSVKDSNPSDSSSSDTDSSPSEPTNVFRALSKSVDNAGAQPFGHPQPTKHAVKAPVDPSGTPANKRTSMENAAAPSPPKPVSGDRIFDYEEEEEAEQTWPETVSGYASPEVERYFLERDKRLKERAERLRNLLFARAEATEWMKSSDGISHKKPQEEEETCSRKEAMRLLFRMYDSFQHDPEIEENADAEREMYEDAREGQISMKAIIEALKKSLKDIESCLSLSKSKNSSNSYSCETIISLIRQMAMGLKSSLSGEIIQISYILQTKKATERILIESLVGILSQLFLALFTLPAIISEEDRELNNQMAVHISGNDGNRDPIVDEGVHATESSSSNPHKLLYSTNNEEKKIECSQGNDETKLISTVETHIDDNTDEYGHVEKVRQYEEVDSQNKFVQQNFDNLMSDSGSNERDSSRTEKKLIESQGNTIGTNNGDDDSTVKRYIPATGKKYLDNHEMDNGKVDVTVENTPMSTDNGATVSEKSSYLISCPVNQSTKNIPVSLPEAKRDTPAVEQQEIAETETNSSDETSQKKPQEEEETYDRKEAMRLLFRIYDSLQYNSEIEECAKRVKRMCEYANGGRISMKSIIMLLKKALGAIEKNLCLSKLKNNTNSRVGDSVFSLFRQMAMGLESSLSEEIIQISNILQDKKGTERILIEQLLAAMSSMFLDLFLLPAIDSKQDRQRDDQYEMIRNSSDERDQEQIVHNVPVMGLKSSSSNKLLDSPNNKETNSERHQQNVEKEKLNSTVQTQIGVETVVAARQSVGSVSRYGEIQSQNFASMELGSEKNDETSINTDNEVLVSEKATSSKIFPVSQSTEYIPVPSQAPSSSYHASIPEAETDAPTTEQQGISGTEVDKDETSQKIPQEEETYSRKEAMRLVFHIYDSFPHNLVMKTNAKRVKNFFDKVEEGERITMKAIIEALKRALGVIESRLSPLEPKDIPNSYSGEAVLLLFTQMAKSLGTSLSEEVIQQSENLQIEKRTERILIGPLLGLMSSLFFRIFALPKISSN